MKTMDDALAVSQRENDNFYVTAFMIEAWLGDLTCRTVAQYAEHRNAKDRRLQQGFAAEGFEAIFGHASDAEFHHIFGSLARFGEFDDCQSRMLARAYWGMVLESPVSAWPVITPPLDDDRIAEAVAFMRSLVLRLGEWVEAVIHAQTHFFSHHAPVAFDPDPEKRELAILGIQQRHFREMSGFQKSWWEWHHGEAADRLSDPSKWTLIGKAMVDVSTTHQNYPALDECIIMLWPLVRRHHWTYRDLMNVIRSVAPIPLRYPCEREQELATYCINVLGLRKGSKKGRSDPNGTPPGYEVARAMCARPDS
ncbi:MAG: hypothetical protein RLZZ505_821 [Verrucomicrobiota bacterium]|jgi:hypothetical protein